MSLPDIVDDKARVDPVDWPTQLLMLHLMTILEPARYGPVRIIGYGDEDLDGMPEPDDEFS